MTVEEGLDDFPVGMRVLAVDDDPTCLFFLGTLLRRCQYQVTTTNQAVTALQMLRENKDKFDLVISDVHMPDMDGFKLLELVGLEMDLPVIMLSAYGDPKLVMKGISHGACDYLLKPVRIEELKNIWQHVVRRRKFEAKNNNNGSDERDGPRKGSVEAAGTGNSDQTGKINKKRKDQDEDDEDRDENGHENEDPSSQKKPRVVWSVDLHRKFVAAVYQLGIDKAVPKKILELMNVEKLTRENVASHLQKYRLYLKRMSRAANHEANMAAVLGSVDSPYFQMADINRLGNFHSAAGMAPFQNTTLRPFPGNGMLGRLNTPAGLGVRGFSSPGTVSLGHVSDHSTGIDDQGKLQHLSMGHNGNILHGMPMPLEPDQMQPNKEIVSNPGPFPVSNSFNTHNPLGGVSNLLVLEGHPQDPQSGRMFSNQLIDNNSRLETWSGAVQSTLNPMNRGESASTMAPRNGGNYLDDSPLGSAPIQMQHAKADMRCQASLNGMNAGPYEWYGQKPDPAYFQNVVQNEISYTPPMNWGNVPLTQNVDQDTRALQRNVDFDSARQCSFLDPLAMKHPDSIIPTTDASLNMRDEYFTTQQRPQSRFVVNDAGSLDDIINAVVKQEKSQMTAPEGDFGSNTCSSLGTCI